MSIKLSSLPCALSSKLSVISSVAIGLSAPAFANLGSFTPSDGYNISVPSGSASWSDVSYYDAGGYGANAGGGSGPNLIAPDSGKWKLLSNNGGFFPTSAARNAALGGAPPYPTTVPPGTVPAYMVGNHFPGRGGDGSNLAFRNDTPVGAGPAVYEYSLDTYDTGGPVPASVTSGTVSTEFYFCPNPGDAPNPAGPADKFRLSFKDGAGNIGFEWGYARDNEVYWRTSTSSNWTYTGIYADASNWDGLKVAIDLTNDTFQMDYYDISASTWLNLAPAGTALGTAMNNFTTLRWQLEDGVFSGTGGKNYFDDFKFNVPEPTSLLLVATGLLPLLRRRS